MSRVDEMFILDWYIPEVRKFFLLNALYTYLSWT